MLHEVRGNCDIDPSKWVEEHGDILFRFALARVRNTHVAEELVQETFLGALRAKDTYSGRASEQTWLVAILRHKIVDYFRRHAREAPVQGEVNEADDSALNRVFDGTGHWIQAPGAWRNPAEALEAAEFWDVFGGCVQALPAKQGEAYALHATDGQTTEEVCKVLGITPTNLRVILHRARLRLRNCLEINWFGASQGRRG